MSTGIRFIAEHYDLETGKTLEIQELRSDKIQRPTLLKEFGYLHSEQIELLQSIQDFKLKYETKLINENVVCPECGKATSPRGTRKSKFHSVLTDHVVSIQSRRCQCGWSSPDSVDRLYGSSLHPDLVEKQVIQGVENSYRQASRQLNAESKSIRNINNDDRIRRNVEKISNYLQEQHMKEREVSKSIRKQLVAVIDGGHLKSQATFGHGFEAMISTVFCPEYIVKVDDHHREITKKTSVASALDDKQKTIKQLLSYAVAREGADPTETEILCLTDGANNCWSIANSLKTHCKTLVNILDWFHITKRFTIINNHIDEPTKNKLEKVKWFLWHGKSEDALQHLNDLRSTITDEKLLSELLELADYIQRNKKYLVNYQERYAKHLPFTSTYAESSVNTVINTRQKNDKRMQWTREGAHHVLQIRTSRFSKSWEQDWENAQEKMYLKAA